MDYAGKVVVITGGANGIGKALVDYFVEAGSKVAFVDIDPGAIGRYCPGNVLYTVGDIAEEQVLVDFSEKIKLRFGKTDYLINNACKSKGGIRSGCSFDDFNYVFKVGVSAPYLLSSLLDFNEGASILNIASTRAAMSQPDTEAYSAAKGGILSLTHALAISLAGKVRVNAISPGWIETDAHAVHSQADKAQHAVGRVGAVEDIVKAAAFLGSPSAGFITGETLTIDGGMSRLMIYHGDHGWHYSNKEDLACR